MALRSGKLFSGKLSAGRLFGLAAIAAKAKAEIITLISAIAKAISLDSKI